MSEVGRKLTFPQHSFSWDILSRRVAKKQLDRSAFLHYGTGVPAAITWFFGISKSGPRSPEVSLVFNGRTFDARIHLDNGGRYRLFWKKDFASALGQAFPDCLSAYQQKLNPNQDAWMQFEKASATRYEVKFSTEPGITDIAVPRPDRKTGITTRAFLGRQGRNYPEEAEWNRKLGSDGEDMVVREEKSDLKSKGLLDLAGRVRNVARSEGDGAGYDVLSFMPLGEEKHIEVKTTKGSKDTPFYITPNELAFSARHPDSYELHRLYNFSELSAGRYILRGDISSQLELKPTQFMAHLLADAAHPRNPPSP